jgi:hypothetical protein
LGSPSGWFGGSCDEENISKEQVKSPLMLFLLFSGFHMIYVVVLSHVKNRAYHAMLMDS